MHVLHNIKARLCKHCSREQEISITYSECVSVALVILHAKGMHCITLSSVASASTILFHVISQMEQFSGKKLLNIACMF